MRALIVGMGGLGCPASLVLARAGVHLTLVDPDCVEDTNLHRQPWHHQADLGRLKVESASEKLRREFPDLEVSTHALSIDQSNAAGFFSGHDVVIDGTDGLATKFLLSDVAVQTGTKLIYGGVLRFTGQYMPVLPGGPCLRCLFESPPDDGPTCAQAGVLGPLAGFIGALQGAAALNVLEGTRQSNAASLQVIDALTMKARTVTVRRAPDCEACNAPRQQLLKAP